MTPVLRAFVSLCLTFATISTSAGSGLSPKSNASSPPQPAAAAEPTSGTTNVNVTVDVLANRHAISSYVYGGAYPQDAAHVTDSGTTVVRWGGNGTSTYNWKLFTNNSANDYFYEDFGASGFGNGSDADSTQFVKDVVAAGSHPLMSMVMLPWVAKSAETSTTQGGSDNFHWSYSVETYGAQCSVDPFNTDAGNGLKTDCATPVTSNAVTTAYNPLLDQPGTSDPPNSVYRNQWAVALATAFGSSPHFYDMDNEVEIWGSTHRDVHPAPTAYNELRDTYLAESRALKTWDPQAIRFGPVTCCWWFYWNGANNNDKAAHAGVDMLPWWLNEIYWQDKIAGTRSVDVLDVHAYPDAPDTSGFTRAQTQALAARIYRDYWDPTYVSESGSIDQPYTTNIQPNKTIPFRIPRLRAIANMIYPGTQISFTEWSAAFAGESDFSTALGDADAYGILGRERMYLASRWVAPVPTNPNYLALKLYTNYDGAHHSYGATSVSATNNGDPNLFSSYASVNSTGKTLTMMVLNKDPNNNVQAQFAFNGFTPQQVTSYTLSSASPAKIVTSSKAAWSSSMSFAPYSVTLLVLAGTSQQPGATWEVNPDTTMVPAGGTATLHPKITMGTANVTLGTPQFDTGITLVMTQPSLTPSADGTITVTAGLTPGFYHYTIPSTDTTGVAQTQSGYILVGNPPASLAATGNKQKGAAGSKLTLSVTLKPGNSGGSAAGGTIFFTTSAGTLSSRTVTTNASGVASVVLTLPSSAETVTVKAEGQYALGHPVVNFTETAQ
jgi:hypothetical protein